MSGRASGGRDRGRLPSDLGEPSSADPRLRGPRGQCLYDEFGDYGVGPAYWDQSSKDYSLPHKRDRVYLVGVRRTLK